MQFPKENEKKTTPANNGPQNTIQNAKNITIRAPPNTT
jgi:hypothetical protein